MQITKQQLAKKIDHTILKPDAVFSEIKQLCNEAKQYNFCSVCINPSFVKFAQKELNNSDVKVCTVVGFPLGATSTESKVFETKQAIKDGADEIDMVINIGLLKSNQLELLTGDISAVYDTCKEEDKLLKVIIETTLLTENEKIEVCKICKEISVDFVKTSTGFAGGGATTEDVSLMKKIVGENISVKASGGIRSYDDAIKMLNSGADRLGTSSGIKIIS